MRTIKFNYWTDMMRCGSFGNVGGTASVDLTEEEEQIFRSAVEPAKTNRDLLGYFDDDFPEELGMKIDVAIIEDYKRKTAKDTIAEVGCEAFGNMSKEEFDSLSEEELVHRFISETNKSEDGWNLVFTVVDLKIID